MAKKSVRLVASSKAVDPTLDALFSSSFGPVKAPPKSRYSVPVESKAKHVSKTSAEEQQEGDDEVLSEISEELSYSDSDEEDKDGGDGDNASEDEAKLSGSSETEDATKPAKLTEAVQAVKADQPKHERKRKRKDEHDDIEDRYLSKLADDDEPTPAEKRQKAGSEAEENDGEESDDVVPVHESLDTGDKDSDLEKAGRTVFLSNVAVEAISSKSAKKTLLAHLSSLLDRDASPAEKIESIRFRSVAFSTGSMPKRAAYITKAVMEATTKSANAYVVYSTEKAARTAASKLNGSEVLGRHVRVDSVAHPSPTDHRRCLFVGNLGFVDDETVLNTDKDGKTTEKKRNKIPSDIEEGLWRTFSTQGKVENVRVIRDPKTRVGKGFAYVQFYDANDVESALLLDGKKFPPMLPRALRVTRAKDPRKTALAQERQKAKAVGSSGSPRNMKYKPKATPEQQSMIGRAGKLLGQQAAFQQHLGHNSNNKRPRTERVPQEGRTEIKTPEQIVFEGRRASSKDGRPKDLKFGKKKGKGRPHTRGSRRAAEWRKKT